MITQPKPRMQVKRSVASTKSFFFLERGAKGALYRFNGPQLCLPTQLVELRDYATQVDNPFT